MVVGIDQINSSDNLFNVATLTLMLNAEAVHILGSTEDVEYENATYVHKVPDLVVEMGTEHLEWMYKTVVENGVDLVISGSEYVTDYFTENDVAAVHVTE